MKSFHYMMMATQSIFQKKILEVTGKHGLLPGQPKVLDFLKDNDGCEQKEIAKGCCLEPATVTGVMGRMEKSGLITRTQLNGNRRSLYVFMTEKGREMSKVVQTTFSAQENRVFTDFTDGEKKEFIRLLGKVYKNLQGEEL